MAADPARHSLCAILRELHPQTEAIRVDGDGTLTIAVHGRHLVLVVRDPQRHAWERTLIERLLAANPSAVVVDVGYPDWRPTGASAHVASFGAGRANLTAVAERLTGRR